MLDPVTNFAITTITSLPSPVDSGTTFNVNSSDVSKFPDPGVDGAFNVVIKPAGSTPATTENAEIVRVISISTNTLTVEREQEGSSARDIEIGDEVYISPTKKVIDDIDTELELNEEHRSNTSNPHEVSEVDILPDQTGNAGKTLITDGANTSWESVGSGNMSTSIYDTDEDGVVDNSEALEGQNGTYYLNRENHTGTQLASTISDFDAEVDNNTSVASNTSHTSDTDNPHEVTAAQVGADPIGTDNSTDVTLIGTPDYITISGQEITRNAIDLTADVTGVLPDANIANDITLTNITQVTDRSHTDLSDVGSNTHPQIDTHIANTSNPHTVTATQVGKDTAQWNADKIQGVTVDDTDIANGKVLAYNSTSGNLEYESGAGGTTDADAVHVNVAAEISGITEKVTPASADLLIIEDSADSNNKKKVQIGNLPSSGGGSGDVVGPASATDNALARFDTTTGKLIQNSKITADDNGYMTLGDGSSNSIGITLNGTGAGAGIDPVITTNADNELVIYSEKSVIEADGSNTDPSFKVEQYVSPSLTNTVELTGNLIKANNINESILDSGVTIESVLIKDGLVDGVDVSTLGTGTGDVVGPASAVDDNIATFDTTTGKLIQDSGSSIANVLDRTNHTGTQVASTISDFAEATSDQIGAMVTGNTETNITITYQDADNTLDFVVLNSSATAKGVVELATTTETTTGTDATRAVTPDGLHNMTSVSGAGWVLDEDNMASDSAIKLATQQSIKAYLDAHSELINNPHSVTAAQAGAVALTGNETIAGIKTFSSFAITPSSTPTTDYQVANKKYVDDNIGGGGSGLTWSEVTGTSQSASVSYGYIVNNVSQVTVTLPSTASVGDQVRVVGKGAGGWKLAQNSGQTVYFGNSSTTTGTGGYLESSDSHDSIELVCITADDDWSVISSVGNMGVV